LRRGVRHNKKGRQFGLSKERGSTQPQSGKRTLTESDKQKTPGKHRGGNLEGASSKGTELPSCAAGDRANHC